MAKTKLIFWPEVHDRIGVTYACVWRWMRAGSFPRSRVVGDRHRVAWFEHEIDQWIADRPTRRLLGDRHGVPDVNSLNEPGSIAKQRKAIRKRKLTRPSRVRPRPITSAPRRVP